MDHLTSLRNTHSHDVMAKFNSASVDCFTNQSSSYPAAQYGHRSPISNQGQIEFNSPAYNLHYGHNVPQCYQSNMSDGQMTSSYIYQNPSQHHSDNYYPFQTQTPPFFPQGHQVASNQLMQSPASPCHSQTTSVNLFQSQSPQFSPLPAHSQNSQVSPRNQHHQTQQIPLVSSQKSKQLQSVQNQQHQPSFLTNGSAQPQSSKQLISKQQNSPKDLTCDGQFYSSQCSQRISTSNSNVHNAQANISNFGNRMQHPSPTHASTVFQSGANVRNQMSGDSWSNSLHGSQYGATMNIHSINQSKPSTYTSPSSFEHHNNTTVASSLQQNRYNKNNGTSNNPQRIKKTASLNSSLTHRSQVPGNPNYCPDYSLFPEYNNMASSHLHFPVSSKAPPSKSVSDPLPGDLLSAQNIHYKSMHPQTVLSHSIEGKNDSNHGNMNRSASGDSVFLERQPHKMTNNNQYSLFSVAALSEPTKSGGRGNKVSDTIDKGSNRINEHAVVMQKNNKCEHLSPVNWYKCPDTLLGSSPSFQSDIEAMQADIASYVSTSGMRKTSNKASHISYETSAQKSTESHTCNQNGFTQTSHALEAHKNSNSTRTGLSNSPKSEVHVKSKNARAEALAAIQIKQELVDSLNKYKTVNSSGIANMNSPSVTKTVDEISSASTNVTHSVRQTSNSTVPTAVKDTGGNSYPQLHADISSRRHSSAEICPRSSEKDKTLQCSDASIKMSILAQTPPSVAKTDDCLQRQKVVDNSRSDQHLAVHSRRHTSPYLLDKSLQSSYETLSLSKQGPNVDRQRSPAQNQSLDFPSQSFIHHLFDQVQSLGVQNSNAGQNMITNRNLQRDFTGTVERNGQGLSESCVKQGYSTCKNAFDTWSPGHVFQSNHAGSTEQVKGNNTAPMTNQYKSKNPELRPNVSNYAPFRIDLPETVDEPVANTLSLNDLNQKTAYDAHKLMKIERSNELNKPASKICYIMLHGYKLICLKSNLETLLLSCQFIHECFPNRSMESINSCIEHTLQINKKDLDHQDKERIVLFLAKSGYQLRNVQTISLDDARQVYHYIYGITCCDHSSCVVELFHLQVDLDVPASSSSSVSVSSSSKVSFTKEPKKEKNLADDKNYGQLFSGTDPKASSFCAGKEYSQKKIEDTTQKVLAKPSSSQISTIAQVLHSDLGSTGSDHTLVYGEDVDNDESDDLILVEAFEDPHVIRWSGDAAKVGGLCNTIIGQLRSYVHESERYLVVDDLCRVFGSTDFYDGVERENMILYSCCQEIANFLNTISPNFPPLQSLYHNLVKEKDIGIHITESNFVPVESSSDKNCVGSSFMKRPLCKQEIIDDECSSPKQQRCENNVQVPKSDNQQSVVQQSLALNQRELELSEEASKVTGLSESVLMEVCETHNSDHSMIGIEGGNKNMTDDHSDLFNKSAENNSLSVTFSKSSSQSVEYNNDETAECNLLAEFEGTTTRIQNPHSVVSSKSSEDSSVLDPVSKFSSQSFENNNGRKSLVSKSITNFSPTTFDSLAQQFVEVNDRETCQGDFPKIPADTAPNATDISNIVNDKESDDASLVRPNYSSDPDSLTSAAASDPDSSTSAATFAESSSLIIIDLNCPASPTRKEKIDQNKSTEPELVPQVVHQFGDPLSESTSISGSCTSSLHTSMQQPFDTENKSESNEKEKVGFSNNHLESTESKQAEPFKSSTLSKGVVDGCFTDSVLVQQSNEQGKLESDLTGSVLKARMEKLKHILETRKSKDLPLPKLLLDTNLNLSLLTNNDNSPGDKTVCCVIETAVEKQSHLDQNSVSSNSRARPSCNNDTIDKNTEIKSGVQDQRSNSSDLLLHDECRDRMAAKANTITSSTVTLPKPPLLSESEISFPLQERTRNILSMFDLDKDQSPPCLLPSSRYFPGNRRFMDDTDVSSSSIDILDARPSCYWEAYAKLWQENRALLGVVDMLRKSLAHAKADKEKSEKISKYYEGQSI